ncbi:MAG: M20/M25/M40 family metallo-hydrolase [bacterium]
MGTCAAGYLYNGSSAAVGRAAPYRVLDRDARSKNYYIVWAPAWVGLTPAAFEHLGAAVRLSEYEILVGLERGLGLGALRAVEHRIELIKLEPVTPVDWTYDGEAPPTKKDPRIEGAINTITEAEYAGYIKQLQDFKTRCTETDGCDAARDYIRNFFALQNLDSTFFPFETGIRVEGAHYVDEKGVIYVDTDEDIFKRTRDSGVSWVSFYVKGAHAMGDSFWVDENVGFVKKRRDRTDTLARTIDGGHTWENVKISPAEPGAEFEIGDWFFVSQNTGWVGGWKYAPGSRAAPFFLKTSNGGKTWLKLKPPGGFAPGLIRAFDEDRLWVGGGFNLYYSNDGGDSWRICEGAVNMVGDIAPVSPREAWGAIGTSSLVRTKDGITWSLVPTGVEVAFSQVEFPDRAHGYAAGKAFVATSDGGATWRERQGAPSLTCDVLSFAGKERGIYGGTKSQELYRTDDGGRSFTDIFNNIDFLAENVIGERRGGGKGEEIVIIGGHFDSGFGDMYPSLAPGAEDNASGTACAMAAARAFRNMSFERTVRYLAFGDEENGLVGSRYYAQECARRGEKIVAVLNADMVAYDEESGARDDFTVGYGGGEDWLFEYLVKVGRLYGGKLIYDPHSEYISDDRSFGMAGYDAIGVIEGDKGTGGITGYPYAHSTEDTLDKLHPALGARFVRDYAATLAHLAGVGDYLFEPEPPGKAVTPFARPFAVYPNPYCYATSAGGVSFVGVKSPATVEIYDLAGRRVGREEVAAGRDECVWRPATAEGETLAPGVYLYRVDGQEQKKAGKIVVAR